MLRKGENGSNAVELFLSKNVSLEGKMTFEGMARLDGKFDGDVLSGDVLRIGETAVINAEIRVVTLIVNGEVNGNVSATAKMEIHSSGKVYGNIDTPALVIEEGGLFEGTCRMSKGVEVAPEKVTPTREIQAYPK